MTWKCTVHSKVWVAVQHQKTGKKILQGFNSHWQPSQTTGLGERVRLLLQCHRKSFVTWLRPTEGDGWLILGRVEVKQPLHQAGSGLVVDEGAAQTRIFPMTKMFSSPAAPSVWGLRSLEGPWRVSSVIAVATAPRHVSDSCPASGMTNTVMSSPEPSFSLGSRQPRSFSTPLDLISRSWAASVYLRHTHKAKQSKNSHYNSEMNSSITDKHKPTYDIQIHVHAQVIGLRCRCRLFCTELGKSSFLHCVPCAWDVVCSAIL